MLQRVSKPKQNGHTFWTHFITLRVEMAVARFNSPTQMNVYISSIWTRCGSGKKQVNMKPLCVKSLGVQ